MRSRNVRNTSATASLGIVWPASRSGRVSPTRPRGPTPFIRRRALGARLRSPSMRSAGNLLGTTRSDQPGPSAVWCRVAARRRSRAASCPRSPVQNTHVPPRGRTGSVLKSVGRPRALGRDDDPSGRPRVLAQLRHGGPPPAHPRAWARGRAARQRVGGGFAVEEHGGHLGTDRQRQRRGAAPAPARSEPSARPPRPWASSPRPR